MWEIQPLGGDRYRCDGETIIVEEIDVYAPFSRERGALLLAILDTHIRAVTAETERKRWLRKRRRLARVYKSRYPSLRTLTSANRVANREMHWRTRLKKLCSSVLAGEPRPTTATLAETYMREVANAEAADARRSC